MWYLTKIACKDFMTFDQMEYAFDKKCFLIQGINNDNDAQGSNGSGKSSFVEAIAVAIFGYSLSGRDPKDMVSWSANDSFCTLDLEMKNGKDVCKIKRKIYSNTRSGELILTLNNKVPSTIPTKKGVTDGVDVKEGNKYILESILDITATDLLNYYLISGKYYQPFLRVNLDKKLEVINRFSKASVIDKAIIKIEKDIEVDNENKNNYEHSIAQMDGYIQALNDSLTEGARSAWESDKNSKLNDFAIRESQIEKEIEGYQEEIETNNAEIAAFNLRIEPIDQESLTVAKDEMKKLQTTMSAVVKEKRAISSEIATIENFLAGLIICPACSHEFSIKSHAHYTKKDLTKKQKNLQEKEKEEKQIADDHTEFKEILYELSKTERENESIANSIKIKEREIVAIQKQQERLLAEFESLDGKIQSLAATTFADQVANVHSQIKDKQKEKKNIEKGLKECLEIMDNATKWLHNFEDFKFYLGNKPLGIITNLVNQYLKFNGSDLNLQIEGFKKLKSGEIRQSLEPIIYRNWQNPQKYNDFSAGERARLDLSVDLAFQQLINSTSKNGGLDLYISDEILNSLDSVGIQSAAKAFDKLDKTILIATHSGTDMLYENVITIEKTNGISKIVNYN